MGVQTTLALFVFSGLFERFPGLKVALIETSAGWYPSFVERLDAAYKVHRSLLAEGSRLGRLPSEYLQEVRVNFDRETGARFLCDHIGPDRLMFGTDYPHIGSYWPYSRYYLGLLLKQCPPDDVDDILWGNAAQLYGISALQGSRAA
jgi:predicted TIM-barrel fold metal-dependent hydrolase